MIGAAGAAGAFLALGMAPLGPALAWTPPAQADEMDWLADLFDPAAWTSGVEAGSAAGGQVTLPEFIDNLDHLPSHVP